MIIKNNLQSHEDKIHSVWAGIVTYNPEIDRLRENINAILAQVSNLIIFDNCSNNIDAVKTINKDIIIIEGEQNYGMAHALNYLAKMAIEGGATDILFLDQDSVVLDGCVQFQIQQRKPDIGIVCSQIIDRNVLQTNSCTSKVYDVKRSITSGSLVNLDAWNSIGGYDELLFVDCVDNDFCDNLRLNNYRITKVEDAMILHEMGHQELAWSIPIKNRDANAPKSFYRRNYPAWRWADTARAEAIMIRKYRGSYISWEERIILLKLLARLILIENNKVSNIKSFISGYFAGRTAFKENSISRYRVNYA